MPLYISSSSQGTNMLIYAIVYFEFKSRYKYVNICHCIFRVQVKVQICQYMPLYISSSSQGTNMLIYAIVYFEFKTMSIYAFMGYFEFKIMLQ